MDDQGQHLTEAEKQVRRLESLRRQREEATAESAQKAAQAPKTEAARIEERLRAMRASVEKAAGSRRRPKIDGKQRSAKLTYAQIKLLEQILEMDKRLRGSVVTRIALNRFLNIENSPEENDMEAVINDILRQIKSRS